MSTPNHQNSIPSEGKGYLVQWNQIQTAWINKRMPQANLFVSSFNNNFNYFFKKLIKMLLCSQKTNEACNQCIDCQMAEQGEHPDMEWIKPEKKSGPIKIDQVRELQNFCYLMPHRAQYRIIIIEAADKMNISSANSLLKILEEPPSHTLFFLIASQLSTLLPTVLSRCHIKYFSSHDFSWINTEALMEQYSEESGELLVMKQSEQILNDLIAVIEHKELPCFVVIQWSKFELGSLIWFLYLVYAQILEIRFNSIPLNTVAKNQLERLASLLTPSMIFSRIDKLNALQRNLSHNKNINQILALEDLLFMD